MLISHLCTHRGILIAVTRGRAEYARMDVRGGPGGVRELGEKELFRAD